ncbi:MAG: LON peptidase substrate-binding domain-containing protein [Anaeromyxobacteraceae bacterium]
MLTATDTARALVAQACGALKVFPLPGAVVLPGTPAPLHIFEPRYRQMTADALEGDRVLALAALVSEGGAVQDRAPVHPIAGVGLIETDERRPDGRYDLLVRGVARVRLVSELANGKPYREFKAEVLEDVWPAGGAAALARERGALEQLVFELVQVLPPESGAAQLAHAAARTTNPSALADLVAAAVVSEPDKRLAVLEELDVGERLALVMSEIAGVVLMLSKHAPSA